MTSLLLIAIISPLIASLLLVVLPRQFPKLLVQGIGIAGFLIPALAAIRVYAAFLALPDRMGYHFTQTIDTGLSQFGIALKLGVNGVSAPLFLLAGIVGLAAGITAVLSIAERKRTYLGLLLVMQSGLMGIFCTYDIFYLYFFHEFALIPSFIMIAIWGGAHRRPAAMEMTIYLTLGAMISLAGLIGIYVANDLASFDLVTLSNHVRDSGVSSVVQRNLFGLLMFGLGILVSLFPFHSWAPRGYGAAPTSVAMLHAGVLKKFGLFVLIQVGLPLLGEGAASWMGVLAILALGNILLIGLVTMAQRDFKQLIAYTSVMHMGYLFLGIATMSVIGVGGTVFLMLAHGLSAALLFNLAVAVQHRCRSFLMEEMGGLGQKAPVLAGLLMAAMMASIGLPGFANFWGELTIFIALWHWNPVVMVLALIGIVISAIYGLRAVAAIAFGQPSEAFQEVQKEHPVTDLPWKDRIPAIILLLSLVIFGLFPSLAMDPINDALSEEILRPVSSIPTETFEALPVESLILGSATDTTK